MDWSLQNFADSLPPPAPHQQPTNPVLDRTHLTDTREDRRASDITSKNDTSRQGQRQKPT